MPDNRPTWEYCNRYYLSPLPDCVENLMNYCDDLGADGWELCSTLNKYAIFKRKMGQSV